MNQLMITGGLGYIGSHVALRAMELGYSCILVDNLSNSVPHTLLKLQALSKNRLEFYECDIRDRSGLDKIFRKHSINTVIHCAGLKSVSESIDKPELYISNNVEGSYTLFDSMQKFNVNHCIFSSSATVYGEPEYLPIDENHPISPVSPYGWSKVQVESKLREICDNEPLWSSLVLRYFNPIGAHSSGIIGERHQGVPSNLMPYICEVANGNKSELLIYGNDYETPDGTGVRDYLHVDDLAMGHLRGVQFLQNDKSFHIMNFGCGKGVSVLELVRAFENANGIKIRRRVVPRRAGDVASVFASSVLARNKLGWTATKSIREMCQSAWNFSRQH